MSLSGSWLLMYNDPNCTTQLKNEWCKVVMLKPTGDGSGDVAGSRYPEHSNRVSRNRAVCVSETTRDSWLLGLMKIEKSEREKMWWSRAPWDIIIGGQRYCMR